MGEPFCLGPGEEREGAREVFPVVTTHGCYVVDGTFTDAIPAERQELFDQFLYLQYYWTNEFIC